jgi:hypothetical protein
VSPSRFSTSLSGSVKVRISPVLILARSCHQNTGLAALVWSVLSPEPLLFSLFSLLFSLFSLLSLSLLFTLIGFCCFGVPLAYPSTALFALLSFCLHETQRTTNNDHTTHPRVTTNDKRQTTRTNPDEWPTPTTRIHDIKHHQTHHTLRWTIITIIIIVSQASSFPPPHHAIMPLPSPRAPIRPTGSDACAQR